MIAKFLSSVVIAAIGLLITWSMQQTQIATTKAIADSQLATNQAIAAAQLDAARLKAQDDKRLQEGQLSVQLMNHLISKDDKQRQIAIIALRRAVPIETYDEVVAVLAKNDPSASVRIAAINQLATSDRPQVTETLASIALSKERSTDERRAAGRATARVSYLTDSRASICVFGATQLDGNAFESEELRHGVFTYFLMRGLTGSADASNDGVIAASELGDYLAREISRYTVRMHKSQQEPYFFGPLASCELMSVSKPITRPLWAAIVGISQYQRATVRELKYAQHDASTFAALLRGLGAQVFVLLDSEATRAKILQTVFELAKRAPADSTVVVYYSGNSVVDKETGANWLAYDSDPSEAYTLLSVAEVARLLAAANVHSKFLFVDAAYSGVPVPDVFPTTR